MSEEKASQTLSLRGKRQYVPKTDEQGPLMFYFDETRGSNDKTNIQICPLQFLTIYGSTDVYSVLRTFAYS